MMEAGLNPLATKLKALAFSDGRHSTAIEGLTLLRVSTATPFVPVVYRPKIVIIGQGAKEVTMGGDAISYNAFHYLLVTIPLPLRAKVTEASKVKPFVGLQIELDLPLVTELMGQMMAETGESDRHPSSVDTGLQIHPMNQELIDIVCRLVDTLSSTERAKILGPLAIRELYYHLLTSREGQVLRAFVHQDRRSYRIAKVLDFIHLHLHESLSVEQLAEQANMSHSTFHEHFRRVTDTSPQQYIKSIRLDKARQRLVEQRVSVSEVAYDVGYSSLSQFSREFKRLFGMAPSEVLATEEGYQSV